MHWTAPAMNQPGAVWLTVLLKTASAPEPDFCARSPAPSHEITTPGSAAHDAVLVSKPGFITRVSVQSPTPFPSRSGQPFAPGAGQDTPPTGMGAFMLTEPS